jgi:hypothetical protein
MIKFNDLDHASIYISDISIKDVETNATSSVGKVVINGELTDLTIEGSKDDDLVMIAYEYIKEKAYDAMDKIKYENLSTSNEIATDDIVEGANPMAISEDIDKVCSSLGFVVGSVAERNADIDNLNNNKLGVCTGWYMKDKEIYILFSDGVKCSINDCKVIKDVNKEIFRFVVQEKNNIRKRAKLLESNIDEFLDNVIFYE